MRRQLARSAVAAALAALLMAPLAHAAPKPLSAEELQSLEKGQALVLRNCGMCHATGRVGTSPDPHAPPFRNLHERYDVENLGEALAEGILTGHPAMPEFRFEPDEVISIIRYLKSIQAKQHAQLAPAADRL